MNSNKSETYVLVMSKSSEQGRQRCAEAKIVHGRETQEIRAERSRKSAELHELVDLDNAVGLFNKKVALRGRPPKGG